MSPMPDSWVGKILLVYLVSPGPLAQAGVAVVNATLETHHGRPFITGTVPIHERDWASGLPVAIAWDQVAHFLVFNTLEDYRRIVAQAPAIEDLKSGGAFQ